ncbi:hypothetical protein E4U32_004841 [Claviceps aff. humidiphila group G2b]|nr:hypothetical protein E4U32_004841 [Claviceps aff. humidiphila group G2b]
MRQRQPAAAPLEGPRRVAEGKKERSLSSGREGLDDLIFQILLDFMLTIPYTIRNIGAFLKAESNLASTNATWLVNAR